MREIALSYLRAGLCVLPADPARKFTTLSAWKPFQNCLPSESQMNGWFAKAKGVCIVAGTVSGKLELLDFDCQAEAFDAWSQLVENESPGLVAKLVIELSQSGGRHVVYRLAGPVGGNVKLASKIIVLSDDQVKFSTEGVPQAEYRGKKYVPRKIEGRWRITPCLIETRGEGGLFLCAPTPGYALEQGQFENIPAISDVEHEILIRAAKSLDDLPKKADPIPSCSSMVGRPGDDFNSRGDIRSLLEKHGWTIVRSGESEYWRRPGKDSGWSASLKNRVFYVFSSNADPFEQDTAYSPFRLFAMLEHAGDFAAAASALRTQGYGDDDLSTADVDLSGIMGQAAPEDDSPAPQVEDPGPIPEKLLRIPGFIGEVMDFCMETAPYPNQVMAFCGAVALQSFLSARKVRDSGDNRTNVYLLGLAHSAAGKDHPRKINVRIIHEAGLAGCLGERFASGEGVQDRLLISPSMIYQTDEIDGILQAINKAKDARHESIMTTLLTMYSSANSIVPMRSKAGKESPGVIDQPSLVIFGTAIPNHYYQALSERMLTNGFFARMIILEAGQRGEGHEPSIRDLPQQVVETARWWADFQPGKGNLEKWHPTPVIVEYSDEARDLLIQTRQETERQYDKAASENDAVGTTVWGRVSEHVRKLALLYAVSENARQPTINLPAVQWASRFVMHQVRRMLFMAANHVADNPFHAECLKVIRKLQESPEGRLQRQHLLRMMHCKAADFDQIIGTLLQQGDIVPVEIITKTKKAQGYRLA